MKYKHPPTWFWVMVALTIWILLQWLILPRLGFST